MKVYIVFYIDEKNLTSDIEAVYSDKKRASKHMEDLNNSHRENVYQYFTMGEYEVDA